MPDPATVIGIACLVAAAFGFGVTAGRNLARRDERARMALRERYR
jgi:hypothetical protein